MSVETVVPVGRELDALVAERVMGWRYAPGCGRWSVPGAHPMTNAPEVPPPYSTDIAAAWEVVEHLRRTPSSYRGLEVEDAGTQCGTWTARIWDKDGAIIPMPFVMADTAPEAICRAALAWAARKS